MSNETATSVESDAHDSQSDARDPPLQRGLYYLRMVEFLLGSLVGLSVLAVGTVAVIAEVKGTWHWAIHLESTISYMGIFIGILTALLVPLLVTSLVARRAFDA